MVVMYFGYQRNLNTLVAAEETNFWMFFRACDREFVIVIGNSLSGRKEKIMGLSSARRIIFLMRLGIVFFIAAILYFCFGDSLICWFYGHPALPFVRHWMAGHARNPVENYIELFGIVFWRTMALGMIGGVVWVSDRGERLLDRCVKVGLGLAAFAACEELLRHLLSPYWWSWGSMRIAWDFAAVHFHTPYPEAVGGPLLSTMYGPLGAFVFWPVVFLKRPEAVLTAATSLNFCYFFFPFVLLLWIEVLRGTIRTSALVAAASAALASVFFLGSLFDSAFCIHVDAPALCLSGAAAVLWACAPDSRRAVVVSAIFSILAIAVKQTFFPVVFIGGGYLFLVRSRALPVFIRTVILGAALFVGTIALSVPWKAFYENFFYLPTHYPWKFADNPVAGILSVLKDLFREGALPLGVTVACLWGMKRADGVKAVPSVSGLWVFLLCAALLVPVSFLGRIKQGGELNTLTPTVYFLILAMTAALAQALSASRKGWPLATIVLSLVVVLIWAPHILRGPNWSKLAHQRIHSLPVRAYEYLKTGADNVYFPFDPLAHILAQGKFYHAYYGILDRSGAGVEISPEQFRAGVPFRTDAVVFPQWVVANSRFMDRFPGYGLSKSGCWEGFLLYSAPGATLPCRQSR
jgi:hypothetical protein